MQHELQEFKEQLADPLEGQKQEELVALATVCRHKFSPPETKLPPGSPSETRLLSEIAATISTVVKFPHKDESGAYCGTRYSLPFGIRASDWQQRRNYNNRLDDNFLEGLKNLSLNPRTIRNRRIPRKRYFVYRKKGHTRQNCPSKQVANDPMDKSLMANDQVKMDADYVQLHYDTIGLKGDFLVEGTDKGNWNKFGDVLIRTDKATYEIPSVSFVPEIGINVLSLHQLACQGFEVQASGTTCVIKRMFEEANEEMTMEEVLEIQNGYLEKYFQEFITSTTNEGRDSADTNLIKQEVVRPLKSSKGKGLDSDEGNSECFMWAGLDIDSDQDTYSGNKYTRQLTVNSFEGFIRFMKLANNNKVVLKHREIFRECFESMLKWFHNTYIKGDVTKLMPPTIGGYEICLFDLYKLVKCFGGYERLNYKMKWDEVSLGFGFSGLYGLRFKEIYVHYLLIPETYFEVAKVGLTSTDDYIRENCLVTGNNEVSMMSEHVNKVDIEGTSRDWEQITSSSKRESWNFIS
ncbi:ARID DNA-binding domain-containing protein [Tanacetum coccineum]